MRFLNSKERKKFFELLKKNYGYEGPKDHAVYEGGREKYYIISKDIEKIGFENIRIRQGGLYIAQKQKGGLRLSMDGAQILGAYCSKKLSLDDKQKNDWMRGEEVNKQSEEGFWIITHNKDILGCGYVKQGWIKNFVPKERRVRDLH